MLREKIKFKLKDKCWCKFFGKLSKLSLKYKSRIYVCVPEYKIKVRTNKVLDLIRIPDMICIKKNNIKITNFKTNKEFEQKLSQMHEELKEIELTIEINGEDENIVIKEMISELVEYII